MLCSVITISGYRHEEIRDVDVVELELEASG